MSSEERTPFTRWQDGHSRIVLLEMTGGPVPEKWYAALAELEQHCMGLEIFAWGARREPLRGTQGALFESRIQAHERGM